MPVEAGPQLSNGFLRILPWCPRVLDGTQDPRDRSTKSDNYWFSAIGYRLLAICEAWLFAQRLLGFWLLHPGNERFCRPDDFFSDFRLWLYMFWNKPRGVTDQIMKH